MTVCSSEDTCLKLSVIIPAYNEANRLPKYLTSVGQYILDRYGKEAEIIVVDDGSSDATTAVAVNADDTGLVRVITLAQNKGKGFAVKTGMLAANGRLRLFADADGATPIEELHKLLVALDGGADIAVASRALKDDSRTVESTIVRRVLGTGYNMLVRWLTAPGIRDTQCGFKLFRGSVAERLFSAQVIPGFGFDPEILFLAHKLSYRVAEVPVNWKDVLGSKVNVLRDSLRMFADLLRININWQVGVYKGFAVKDSKE